ncbi:MAG TPA: sigma-70 family RNA polymerase sigma factor [Acidimicrobiales bacterium]|nr:sigma-70 family RNA polymerase sigma factor [Acidimicrobiales bacterium]
MNEGVDSGSPAGPGVVAWSEVFVRERPRLLAFARRRLGSSCAAEDVVAETFVRAIEATHRFRADRGSIEGWLFGVARNVVHEHQRRASHSSTAAIPDHAVVDLLEHRADVIDMSVAFAALPFEDRQLLTLRVVEGRSSAEVGQITGRRAGAVRMAQVRALERLRSNMTRPSALSARSA